MIEQLHHPYGLNKESDEEDDEVAETAAESNSNDLGDNKDDEEDDHNYQFVATFNWLNNPK